MGNSAISPTLAILRPIQACRLFPETSYIDGRVDRQTTNVFVIVKPDGSSVINRDFRQETILEYDEVGNPIKTTRAGYTAGTLSVSVFTTAQFDSQGRRVAETDEIGLTKNFEFDGQGRLTAVLLPPVPDPQDIDPVTEEPIDKRPRYEYGYDAQGNQTVIRDPLGRETHFTFDARGNQTSRELPLGVESPETGDFTEHFDCMDSRGQLTLPVSFEGIATRSVFDATSGLLAEQRFYSSAPACNANPDTPAEIWTRGYDPFGREVSVVQDSDGNLATTGDQRVTTTTFTATSSVQSVAGPEGKIHYEYDALGRQIRTWTGPDSQSIRTDTAYAFDSLGRMSKVELHVQNGVDLSTPEATDYIYDLLGNLDQVRGANGVIADYDYDAMNRLEFLRHYKDVNSNGTYESNLDTLLAEFDYELRADGKRTGVSETDDQGRVTRIDWSYDPAGRLIREAFNSHDQNLDFLADYQFDLASNRLAKLTDTNPDWTALANSAEPSFDEAIAYSYDANDRLLMESLDTTGDGVAEKTTVYGWTMTQQTSKTEWLGTDTNPTNGTKLSHMEYQFNLQGRMSGATVDSNGDGTIDSTSAYGYDSRGIRVSQTVNGVTTRFLFDHHNPTGYAQVLEEIDSTGQLIRSYKLGLDVISQFTSDLQPPVSSLAFLHDGHGSTRALTDAVGSVAVVGGVSQVFAFDAYGNARGFDESAAASLLLYSGEWFQIDIDQQYLRARFYDPVTATFVRLDDFFGNLSDPQSLHKYLYVHGDPIQGIDPTGNENLLTMLLNVGIRAYCYASIAAQVSIPYVYAAWQAAGITTLGYVISAFIEEAMIGSVSPDTEAGINVGVGIMQLLSAYTGVLVVFPRTAQSLRDRGGLRWGARETHKLAGSHLQAHKKSSVAIAEAEVNGVRNLYAAGSGGRLNAQQIAKLKSLGVPDNNIFRGPNVTVSEQELNHAEQIIARNLPTHARVLRWGISWSYWDSIRDSLPFPCTACQRTVLDSGGIIEINEIANPGTGFF